MTDQELLSQDSIMSIDVEFEKPTTILYSINNNNYKVTTKWINNNGNENSIKKALSLLEKDKKYHLRIIKNDYYILFGDIDHYDKTIEDYFNLFIPFMKKYYNVVIDFDKDVSYTKNDIKTGSYHFSINKYYTNTITLKNIFDNFLNLYRDEFINDAGKVIDTTIYTDKWFRLPNQTKPTGDGLHRIINGQMINFLVDFIPHESILIDTVVTLETKTKTKKTKKTKSKNINISPLENETTEDNNEQKYIDLLNIYSDKDCNQLDYDEWVKIGMVLYNIDTKFIKIYNDFSKRGKKKYEGYEAIENKWKSFKKDELTINTIIKYLLDRKYNKKIKEWNAKYNKNDDEEAIINFFENYTETDLINIYLNMNDNLNKYLIVKEEKDLILYKYNEYNVLEEKGTSCPYFLIDIKKSLTTYINEQYNLLSDPDTKIINLFKIINKKINCIKNIKELEISIKITLYEQQKQFDFNSNVGIFCFKNVLYDIEKNEYRKINKNDYIIETNNILYEEFEDEEGENS